MTGAPPEIPGETSEAKSGTTAPGDPPSWRLTLREIVAGNVLTAVLALVLAVIVGSLLVAVTDDEVREASKYFFSRPGDTVDAAFDAIWGAYTALFQGSVYNNRVDDPATAIRPLTETLKFAGPLILAGLGVGLAFRAGLFNIGGRGQMLLGGAAAGWIGVKADLPAGIHLVVALLVAMLFGGLWGALAGFLKARTGAHEVIVTIMLNYVGFYLVFYALSQESILQAPNSANPKSLPIQDSATLPRLLGDRYTLHLGFLLALVAVAVVWWILNRSAFGFRIRAAGENPEAARTAGIDVGRTYTVVMLVAGALVGLAGANQVLGTVTSGVTVDLDAGIGFDAITVALLGRSRPLGILAAGLLFGAFKAGGFAMQASQGIPIDLVLVVQSLIVLFIAAPPLVRAVFRLPAKEAA
ncbi:ABC transporter permease [Nocardioides caldifontis]|uniref:ABC transporter permease n=1 Tax=Nocardioides caldifontis TaxID=2588938 RepID=UPI00193A72BB|nr:ABC transporter permease [Nocardioides caldifontis]